MWPSCKALAYPELNKTESTVGEWGREVKAAYTTRPLLAALESVQENIYFAEVSPIDNVLSVRLYEMEREKQWQWVCRERGRESERTRPKRPELVTINTHARLFRSMTPNRSGNKGGALPWTVKESQQTTSATQVRVTTVI